MDDEDDHMKAFDTLLWDAMDDIIVDRGMPQDLRPAHWELHAGRTLTLNRADGAFTFTATPRRGIPQSAHPCMRQLSNSCLNMQTAFGFPLSDGAEERDVEDHRLSRRPFQGPMQLL